MAKVKFAAAVVPIVVALALLALLVLVSTTANEDVRRRVDVGLRHTEQFLSALDSAARAAVRDGRDAGERLQELENDRQRLLQRATDELERLYPPVPGSLERAGDVATELFNVIDPDTREPLEGQEVRAALAALRDGSRAYDEQLQALVAGLENYARSRRFITGERRDFVRELRDRGLDDAADTVYQGTQQVLSQVQESVQIPRTAVNAIAEDLPQTAALEDPADRSRLRTLTTAMRTLVPAREAVLDARQAMAANELPDRLSTLRQRVNADTLRELATVNEARVLLNVYTVLLLGILAYFGARLRVSYRALNRSHEELEARVAERTRDLEETNHELRESQVQLVQAEKMSSLGQLVAGVMHEINTPLMYVQLNVETTTETLADVEERLAPALNLARAVRGGRPEREELARLLNHLRRELNPEEFARTLQDVEQLARDSLEGLGQIAELVQSLKDFSRLDRAAEERFDVREGLEKTLTITHNLLKHGIEVERDFEEVPEIFCSPSQINQIFINLVTNAVQAMDGEGWLTLATRNAGDWVEVSVTDTGCGIPPEHVEKILDPFFTTKPVGQGTGLGLSIVKRIVDDHGGEIAIDSEPGTGTCITVTLPVGKTQSEAA